MPCGPHGVLLLLWVTLAYAADNGVGQAPPMGWRSWNFFQANVNQSVMQAMMDSMVSKKRQVDGVPTSLCELGYCDIGLDDNWQDCGKGTDGFSYHAELDGHFHPVVNEARFPDMAAMTQYAHRLGLTAGWYGNNCICKEEKECPEALYKGDVEALVRFGFDGIKLDGCGQEIDLDLWYRLINATGRRVVIENCHWGLQVPNATWCPYNFFRTSGDIQPNYAAMLGNLLTTTQYAVAGISRPGCWAYPDMMEVGVPGLSQVEARSHFGAWCIVSSPLILSHDLKNDEVSDAIWPIISNKEAIAVNQAWAGHSGSPYKNGPRVTRRRTPAWQYYYKPLGSAKVALLVMNHDSVAHSLELDVSEVPGLSCPQQGCAVRDIWRHYTLPARHVQWTEVVQPHDSRFYVLSPATAGDFSAFMV